MLILVLKLQELLRDSHPTLSCPAEKVVWSSSSPFIAWRSWAFEDRFERLAYLLWWNSSQSKDFFMSLWPNYLWVVLLKVQKPFFNWYFICSITFVLSLIFEFKFYPSKFIWFSFSKSFWLWHPLQLYRGTYFIILLLCTFPLSAGSGCACSLYPLRRHWYPNRGAGFGHSGILIAGELSFVILRRETVRLECVPHSSIC